MPCLIVDLIGDRARLAEHGAPGLGVGVGVLRLAFVEEAQPERVHADPVRIVVAALRVAAAVLVLRRLEVGRVGVDRRHVAGLPMAGRPRAELDEHAQHFAGVVLAAAHLHHVGLAGEIARAHLRVGLEAARAGDHGLGLEVVAARPAR